MTGVPEGWASWYRDRHQKASPAELERAARIQAELDQRYPVASEEHRRVLDEAERLVQESNARLRASGAWGKKSDNLLRRSTR